MIRMTRIGSTARKTLSLFNGSPYRDFLAFKTYASTPLVSQWWSTFAFRVEIFIPIPRDTLVANEQTICLQSVYLELEVGELQM